MQIEWASFPEHAVKRPFATERETTPTYATQLGSIERKTLVRRRDSIPKPETSENSHSQPG